MARQLGEKHPHSDETKTKLSLARTRVLMAGRDPHQLVSLARRHTIQALLVLVKLMNGEGPPTPLLVDGSVVLDEETGKPKTFPAPVPPQVVMRAAEIIIERGYGKSPQAILVKGDENVPGGVHAIPIMERIAMIMQSRSEQGQTTDLEASEQDEPVTVDIEPQPVLPAAPDPKDLI